MLRFVAIFGLIAVVTLLAAFTSFDPGPSALPEDADNRGTLRFAIPNDPGNMDPGRTSASTDFRVVKCIYEPLLVIKPGGIEIEPGTAGSMPEVSEDGLTYTFKIREEAKWSDGVPVTAGDFVFGWRRAMLKETAGKYETLFNIIKGVPEFKEWRTGLVEFSGQYAEYDPDADEPASSEEDEYKPNLSEHELFSTYPQLRAIHEDDSLRDSERKQAIYDELWQITLDEFDKNVGIKAPDQRTFVVTLKAPTAYFDALCAFPTFSPMPKHHLEPMAKIDEAGWYIEFNYFGDPDLLVTNGAYVLSEWRHKVRMVFDQNPHYWNKDAMGNIRIVQETIPDTNLQFLRYEEGLLDWIPDAGTELKQKLMEQKRLAEKNGSDEWDHVHNIPNAGTYYYEFNCRPELPNGIPNPMADPRVRRAMGMCIDREKIVRSVTEMNEPIALLMVPDTQIAGYTGPIEAGLPFNPDAAKKLLAEAGYPDGEGFPPIKFTVNNDSGPGHSNIALPVIKSWEDNLGIKVDLEQIEFKVLLERATNGNYHARRAGWFGDYADPTTWLDMYRTGDSNNDAAYGSLEYDQLLKDAALELDKKKRFEMLAKAEAILLQDAPIVPIFFYTTVTIYDKEKVDIGQNAWNNLRLELVEVKRKGAN
ncbi:MAG: peptide ABC transporter substrate-binding protein [Planctomycetota bacterium]